GVEQAAEQALRGRGGAVVWLCEHGAVPEGHVPGALARGGADDLERHGGGHRLPALVSSAWSSPTKEIRFHVGGLAGMKIISRPLGRPLKPLQVSDDERAALEGIARRHKSAQNAALRSRIVLLCADGLDNGHVAERLGITRQTVGKWRERFIKDRLEG